MFAVAVKAVFRHHTEAVIEGAKVPSNIRAF